MSATDTQKTTPGVARFRALIERAQFEARLAADLAGSERLGGDVLALLAGVQRSLRACLTRVGEGERPTDVDRP